MSSRVLIGRGVAVAGLCGLALAACGRRGPLEAPPDAAAASVVATRPGPATAGQANASGHARAPDGETSAEELAPSPVPTPRTGGRKRGYVVPKDPFVLDPLL